MTAKKKEPTRAAPSDDLSGRIKGSGLIQPGARRAMAERVTPLDKVVRVAKRFTVGKKKPAGK